jgi:hypothetical protein
MLYFAYGSNLLEERLRLHVPTARFVAVGELPGWRREFHLRSTDGSAKCNAVNSADNSVLHGALYEIDVPGRRALDEWEGLGSMYGLAEAIVRTVAGEHTVFFYVGSDSFVDRALRPYDWYLASLIAGARRLALPAAVVEELTVRERWSDPDADRARRNWGLIPPDLRLTWNVSVVPP